LRTASREQDRNAAISTFLRDGRSWRDIMDATGCSRTLLVKIARERCLKAEANVADAGG